MRFLVIAATVVLVNCLAGVCRSVLSGSFAIHRSSRPGLFLPLDGGAMAVSLQTSPAVGIARLYAGPFAAHVHNRRGAGNVLTDGAGFGSSGVTHPVRETNCSLAKSRCGYGQSMDQDFRMDADGGGSRSGTHAHGCKALVYDSSF